MTVRGAFVPKDTYPYVEEIAVRFQWYGGFAKQQKQRCATAMHMTILDNYPVLRPLEISSSSGHVYGTLLSAMNVKKWSNVLNKYTSVESAFQSSRVYQAYDGEQIGPFPEYLGENGFVAKKKVKEASRGLIACRYEYEGMTFPVPDFHISLFYDYLFLNALLEEPNKTIAKALLDSGFNCFTDLATKALNSQARSCALFLSLSSLGLIDKVKDFSSYLEFFRVDLNAPKFAAEGAYDGVQLLNNSYPLGVTQYHSTITQKVTPSDVEKHYSLYGGYVTLDNLKQI